MNAVIASRAGLAVLIDGDQFLRLDVGSTEPVLVARHQLHLLLNRDSDLVFLDGVDPDRVRSELHARWDNDEALDLALLSLDASLPPDLREEVIQELTRALEKPEIRRHVESVLFAHPLPPSADLPGARAIAAGVSGETALFYDVLASHQGVIRDVRLAWEAIPDAEFGMQGSRSSAQKHAVEHGLFVAFARALIEGGKLDVPLFNALSDAQTRAMLGRNLLMSWVAPLRRPHHAPTLEEEPDEISGESQRLDTKQSLGAARTFERVQAQKRAIVLAIRNNDLPRVWQYVVQLVEFQLVHGDSEYAVKSLCDLAMEAKRAHLPFLQLQLTERARQIKPDDAWTLSQYADALIAVGRHADALAAYERAGALAMTKTGRAKALKAKRLEETLRAYEEAIVAHPEEVVAKIGRAEVLKSMNRLEQSLAAYDEVVATHPADIVAKTGRAEVLRVMNRLEESLAAYEEVIAAHPENVVAKTKRAEVLRAMNRLEESLAVRWAGLRTLMASGKTLASSAGTIFDSP